MTPEAETDGFDPDTVIDALSGTWGFPYDEGGRGLLHFTKIGRVIQMIHNPARPKERVPMRLWYSVESPTQLSFRFKPGQEGWLRGYDFDSGTLTLSAEDRKFVCTRPAAEEIPDWFREALASFVAGL